MFAPTSLPRRRFFPVSERNSIKYDEHGFLHPESAARGASIEDVCRTSALILAPPWMGKSYVANSLRQHLHTAELPDGSPLSQFVRFHRVTALNELGSGANVKPQWWDEWRDSDSRALWIIDAVDEDVRACHEVLTLIEDLQRQYRERLVTILLCRENEWPADHDERIQQIFVGPGTPCLRYFLAVPDAGEAESIAGGPDRFERVCSLVRANGLNSIAGLPCVIKALAGIAEGTALTVTPIWDTVLKRLLEPRDRSSLRMGADVRFKAAKRIAAVLTFSEASHLGSEGTPSIDDCIPTYLLSWSELRKSASELISTNAFTRTSNGFAIADAHVREWLAAFEMQQWPLAAVQNLLSADGGHLYPHALGVSAILAQISQDEAVRAWIVECNGGIPPRSAACPWTLRDILAVVDRLQEQARRSPYGLPVWRMEGLDELKIDGLDAELAKRLSGRDMPDAEQILLLRIAQETVATGCAEVAAEIVQDLARSVRVRQAAAYALHKVGRPDVLQTLVPFVKSIDSSSTEERSFLSVLLRSLYEHRLIELEELISTLPDETPHFADATMIFTSHVLEELTINEARRLLPRVDWAALRFTFAGEANPDVQRKFISRSLGLILEQEQLIESDFELMRDPLVYAFDHFQEHFEEVESRVMGRREFRRAVAGQWLQSRNAPRRAVLVTPLQWLTGEDAEWLVEQLLRLNIEGEDFWNHALGLAYRQEASAGRNSIRKRVRQSRPGLLKRFDRNRKNAQRRSRRSAETREARAREQAGRTILLDDGVQQVLGWSASAGLKQLHALSQLCFVSPSLRAQNVAGSWRELAAELQTAVLGRCKELLSHATPSPIPDTVPYSAGIYYEAKAFASVLEYDAGYEPSAKIVGKWLDSVLFCLDTGKVETLVRCCALHADVTEECIERASRRELSKKDGEPWTALSLPAECWSHSLAGRLAELVEVEAYNAPGRYSLLRVLAGHMPDVAMPIASAWVRDENADRVKQAVGVDAMLIASPPNGVSPLETLVSDYGHGIVQLLSAFGDSHGRSLLRPSALTVDVIERLAAVLLRAYPCENDPDRNEGRFVYTVDMQQREFRDALIYSLLNGRSDEAERALERLGALSERVRNLHMDAKANEDASRLLESCSTSPSRREVARGILPVGEVVRLLDDASYRVIRTSADLRKLVADELRQLEESAGFHVWMLYGEKEKEDEAGETKRRERKRLHETALQSYLHCRLSDRLQRRVADSAEPQAVFLDREPHAPRDRPQDLKVQAQTLSGEQAIVVVEVKWSDNDEVVKSVGEQLGIAYLRDQGLTDGVYFVGWCGKGPNTQLGTMEALESRLLEEISSFRQANPDINIDLVVLKLSFREAAASCSTSTS